MSFQLDSYSSFIVNSDGNRCVRMRIECTADAPRSNKVFAYIGTTEDNAHFNHVCSGVEYKQIPEDTPYPTRGMYWCRRSYVDFTSIDPVQAQRRLYAIISDIHFLEDSLLSYASTDNKCCCSPIKSVRTRIECNSPNDSLSSSIFAYRTTDWGSLEFDHVCTAVEYKEYPEYTPDTTTNIPWCRREYADFLSDHPDKAARKSECILADVRKLYDSMAAYNDIVGHVQHTFGGEDDNSTPG